MTKGLTYKNVTYIALLCFVKFFLIYLVLFFDFGSTFFLKNGDAETYHLYATGYLYDRVATNFWFWFLKTLNDFGFYNREIVLYFILLINLFLIPIIFSKIVHYNSGFKNDKIFFVALGLLFFFPSILYHSFDIYRDVVMLFVFFLGLYSVKNSKKIISLSGVVVIFFGIWLCWFRDYLGFSFLLAYFLSFFFKVNSKKFNLYIIIYLFVLFVLNYIGAFDPLIDYRNWFVENDANTNLKIDFSNKGLFFINFFKSAFIQLFGFYFLNASSIILFLFESTFFTVSLFYVLKNRNLFNNFLNFCFIFFIIYTSIWLISNDNFGTAIRLRWFSYFPIFIAALIIYQMKHGVKK